MLGRVGLLNGGACFIFALEKSENSVANIGPNNIVETGPFKPQPPLQERLNTLTMSLVQSADNDYLAYDLPELQDAQSIQRDGKLLPVELGQRLFVNLPAHATRIGNIQLRRARATAKLTYELFCHPADFDGTQTNRIIPTDRVLVTDPYFGLVNA